MTDVGRAGRLRVERRLVTARHGAALLDRKERILRDELDRVRLQADRTGEQWAVLARAAAVWARRAAGLDGWTGIDAASPASPVQVDVEWGALMGVAFPQDARCAPAARPSTAAGGSSALWFAAGAHWAALQAGVEHAAARRALLLVHAEVAATRTRRLAVQNRWIPRLEGDLLALRRQLDAQELEEGLRLRWSADTYAATTLARTATPRRVQRPPAQEDR